MDERDPHRRRRKWSVFAVLAALAYLGFYLYGLVMGVFEPLELAGFTVAAVVMIVAIGVLWLRARTADPPTSVDPATRERNRMRERRGF